MYLEINIFIINQYDLIGILDDDNKLGKNSDKWTRE